MSTFLQARKPAWNFFERFRRDKALRHDVAVYRVRLSEASGRGDAKRAEEIAENVRAVIERMRPRQAIALWKDALDDADCAAEFLAAIAKASPDLLETARSADVETLYDLLGRTLKRVPPVLQERVAVDMLRAVLRSRRGVPNAARSAIIRHRDILMRYPDVWRYIGSFER